MAQLHTFFAHNSVDIRHFFDADYCSDLLEDNGFSNIEILSGEQKLYGYHAAFVKCTAIAG